MNQDTSERVGPAGDTGTEQPEDEARWPYASLLLFGFYGRKSPGGKRLVRETTIGLALFVVAAVALNTDVESVVLETAFALALPCSVWIIGWAYSRYLQALDELNRLLQLKAFAFSYGAVMALAYGMAGLIMADPVRFGAESPVVYLGLLVLAEPLRGVALAYLARKHR